MLLIRLIDVGALYKFIFTLHYTERRKNAELREQLGLEPVSLVIKETRLGWFGHMECKADTDLIKRCTAMEVEATRPTENLRNTWWDGVRRIRRGLV